MGGQAVFDGPPVISICYICCQHGAFYSIKLHYATWNIIHEYTYLANLIMLQFTCFVCTFLSTGSLYVFCISGCFFICRQLVDNPPTLQMLNKFYLLPTKGFEELHGLSLGDFLDKTRSSLGNSSKTT